MGLEIVGLVNILIALALLSYGLMYVYVMGKDNRDRGIAASLVCIIALATFISGVAVMGGALLMTPGLATALPITLMVLKGLQIVMMTWGTKRLYGKWKNETRKVR